MNWLPLLTVPLTITLGLIAGWNLGSRNYRRGIFYLILFSVSASLNTYLILQ